MKVCMSRPLELVGTHGGTPHPGNLLWECGLHCYLLAVCGGDISVSYCVGVFPLVDPHGLESWY